MAKKYAIVLETFNNFLKCSRKESKYDFILISTFSRHCLTVSSKYLCAVKFGFEWFEQFHNTLNDQNASSNCQVGRKKVDWTKHIGEKKQTQQKFKIMLLLLLTSKFIFEWKFSNHIRKQVWTYYFFYSNSMPGVNSS